MIVDRIGDIDLVMATPEHIPQIWEILQSHPMTALEPFFAGSLDCHPKSADQFAAWIEEEALAPLAAVRSGEVVGASYLDYVYPMAYASVNVVAAYRRTPLMVAVQVARGGLRHYVERFELRKVVAFTRKENLACRLFMRLAGFQVDGVIRRHKQVMGEWRDYVIGSLLSEELLSESVQTRGTIWP